jgi:hypothetical protein
MWKFYPSATEPPAWAPPVVDEFAAARSHVESMLKVGVTNDASAGLRPELIRRGFEVETGVGGRLPERRRMK